MKDVSKRAKNPANVFAGRNLKYFMDVNGIKEEQLAASFGIEPDSLQRILSGRNAISGPYNYILLNEYNCDLNFIYGGVSYSDKTNIKFDVTDDKIPGAKMNEAVSRELHYLADVLEDMSG